MGSFASDVMYQKYSHDGKESWGDISQRVSETVLGAIGVDRSTIKEVTDLIYQRKFLPGGRYLYATGRPYHNVQNCFLFRAEDSRQGWGTLLDHSVNALSTGGGVGTVYSDVRASGLPIKGTGGIATGPIPLMQMVNEVGRGVRQGGSRRSALWSGLHWNHPDIFKFIELKNWSKEVREMKQKDFNFPATMDGTNISVILDNAFFAAFHNPQNIQHSLAQEVYWKVCKQMLKTAEPGFSIDHGINEGENLRNACTEVTSYDDSDVCNLASINLARIDSEVEMLRCVELGTLFLLAGTVYSDVPYQKVDEVRSKNRRLGLGLMGMHEFLLQRNLPYGPSPELTKYLKIYASSGEHANEWADVFNLSHPVKTRAIAPTGSIAIIAETTSGIEPLFCAAYKRRYLKGDTWAYQYVVDPIVQSLVDSGINSDVIEDAYMLAEDVERRIAFQSYVQGYVDHSISSTINLPAWGSDLNNEGTVESFGNTLLKYLPTLRGMTCYPDGARGGQPLTRVSYKTAMKHKDEIFYETGDICDISSGASCGS